MTQSRKNQVILAAAGTGKTTLLVDEALSDPTRRVLFTTYTLENVAQIEEYIVERRGCIPPNVTVMSWYTVLLRDGVRPYQRTLFPDALRVASVHFERVPETIGRPKKTEVRYYLTKAGLIYRDRMSAFAFEATGASNGALISRLEGIYDLVIVDELQDMAGYDLDILELLFKSRIAMHCCGDLRQATYTTNDHSRNKQFRKGGMIKWIRQMEAADLISVEERRHWGDQPQHGCAHLLPLGNLQPHGAKKLGTAFPLDVPAAATTVLVKRDAPGGCGDRRLVAEGEHELLAEVESPSLFGIGFLVRLREHRVGVGQVAEAFR